MNGKILFPIFTMTLAVLFMLSGSPMIGTLTANAASATTAKAKATKKVKEVKKGKISINTADAKVLTQIPGVGPKTAKSIVDYRKKNGKFKSFDDLLKVKGIGKKSLKKMKPLFKL